MEGESLVKSKVVCFSHARRPLLAKKSGHRGVRFSTRKVNSTDSTCKRDICGLKGNYDVFSDDDSENHKRNECNCIDAKRVKSQMLSNKSVSKDIHHKFDLIDKENAKVQFRIKNLYKNTIKKDKIIAELIAKNVSLKEKLEELIKNNANQDSNLIDFANTNNRLQKEIEKKNLEISELHTKLDKSDFTSSNLLKDIEFYKSELTTNKKENINQQQKYTEKKYEELQKKFYEIKIENSKLCKKFKEIRVAGENNSLKSPTYHVLSKKFETVQHELMKMKMENKKLKDTIRKNKQASDDETSKLIDNYSQCKVLNEKIEQLTQIKIKLEEESQIYKTKLDEKQLELRRAKSLATNLQSDLEKRVAYIKVCEDQIKNYKIACTDLENKVKEFSIERDKIMKQHVINEENNNKLKLKLDELARERSKLLIQNVPINKENKCADLCENCILLKQELEKLGYANLRLNKQKHYLQSNFQKLSIKTSKLTLKMEELELEKQKQLTQRQEDHGKDETLLQQNFLLSKRLHNLLKKSEKLFKAHVIKQQAKSEKDELTPAISDYRIIEELNENLGTSKSNLEMIESKLDEEEWKLNAALKHIKLVKDQIKMDL